MSVRAFAHRGRGALVSTATESSAETDSGNGVTFSTAENVLAAMIFALTRVLTDPCSQSPDL